MYYRGLQIFKKKLYVKYQVKNKNLNSKNINIALIYPKTLQFISNNQTQKKKLKKGKSNLKVFLIFLFKFLE